MRRPTLTVLSRGLSHKGGRFPRQKKGVKKTANADLKSLSIRGNFNKGKRGDWGGGTAMCLRGLSYRRVLARISIEIVTGGNRLTGR